MAVVKAFGQEFDLAKEDEIKAFVGNINGYGLKISGDMADLLFLTVINKKSD